MEVVSVSGEDSVDECEGKAVQESMERAAQHFVDICIFLLLLLLLSLKPWPNGNVS